MVVASRAEDVFCTCSVNVIGQAPRHETHTFGSILVFVGCLVATPLRAQDAATLVSKSKIWCSGREG